MAQQQECVDYLETNDEGRLQGHGPSESWWSRHQNWGHGSPAEEAKPYWVTLVVEGAEDCSRWSWRCAGFRHFKRWAWWQGIDFAEDSLQYDAALGAFRGKLSLTADEAALLQAFAGGKLTIEAAPVEMKVPVSRVKFECPDTQTEGVTFGLAAMTGDVRDPDNSTYAHDKTWGQGVDVYVLDTGIMCEHEEFDNNCHWGANLVDNLLADDSGHGTHIAATIAGKVNGVAKSATVVAVRIARDGNTNKQSVVEAIQYVVEATKQRGRRGVINMSIQFPGSTLLNDAVNAATLADVVVVSAAGNGDEPSCEYSPSGAASSITVGLHDVNYNPQWSSYGKCVTLYAPGYEVWSADNKNATSYRYRSGTSMAAPHVSAIAAVYLTERPQATPASVKAFLVESAHRNLLSPLRAFDQNLVARIPCEGTPASHESIPEVVDRVLCPAGTETKTLQGAGGGDSFLATGNGSDIAINACWEIKCDGLVTVNANWITADAVYYRNYINVTEVKSKVMMSNYGYIEKDRQLHGDVFVSFVVVRLDGELPMNFNYTCTAPEVSQPEVETKRRVSRCPARRTHFRPSEDNCYNNVLRANRRSRSGELAYLPEAGYPASTERCWMLSCRRWVKVEPQFVDLEQGFDTLRITDRSPYKRVLSGNYSQSNETELPEVMYFRKHAIVKFTSDESVTAGGFLFKWSCDDSYTPPVTDVPAPVPFPEITPNPNPQCSLSGCLGSSCDWAIKSSFDLYDCATLAVFGCDCTGCACAPPAPPAPCVAPASNEVSWYSVSTTCWKIECPANQYAVYTFSSFSLAWHAEYLTFAKEDGVRVSRGGLDFTARTIDTSDFKEQVGYVRFESSRGVEDGQGSPYGFRFQWTCVDREPSA
eukprot:TRINITY_DN1518_c0_g1_i7.p1 TRINITY_DN1518_c0_g1~~TRINITY_DN1518_c0_g1_i7.p1  ORF type:complete len:978 (+),score=386.99 TRINITY_DN1518_c0_g1_i7:311-2935(+)